MVLPSHRAEHDIEAPTVESTAIGHTLVDEHIEPRLAKILDDSAPESVKCFHRDRAVPPSEADASAR